MKNWLVHWVTKFIIKNKSEPLISQSSSNQTTGEEKAASDRGEETASDGGKETGTDLEDEKGAADLEEVVVTCRRRRQRWLEGLGSGDNDLATGATLRRGRLIGGGGRWKRWRM